MKQLQERELKNITTKLLKNKNYQGNLLHAKSKYDGAERTEDLLEIFKQKYRGDTIQNMKKQTAVKYLEEKLDIMLPLDFEWDKLEKIINKAKTMEKEQAFEFWQGGINCTEEGGKSFEQYYNETYV